MQKNNINILEFKKMHGLGNDFVILDFRGIQKKSISIEQIIKFSDRRLGIGCDQLIILQDSKLADCKMVIFNADGSESGACGNASRCVAKLLDKEKGSIEVDFRILEFSRVGENYSINMGKAEFEWDKIPIAKKLDTLNLTFAKAGFERAAAVNIGNPHLIFFINAAVDLKIAELGSYFENHEFFPEKINVNFAQILSKNHIKLRVWERGVGETLACGSGASATVSIAYKKGLVDNKCKVSLPGGDLMIEVKPEGEVYMTGAAEEVFNGYIELSHD